MTFLRTELPKHFPVLTEDGHGKHSSGIGVISDRPPYHTTGRAADIFFHANIEPEKQIADALFYLFIRYYVRLDVHHIIWNRQIFSQKNPSIGLYTGKSPHTNHIHIFFNEEGANRTPMWLIPKFEDIADGKALVC